MTLTPTTDMDLLIEVREMAREARRSGNMPRVHPNGFIQLDLQPTEGWDEHEGHSGANRRLHIWNPPGIELPHQGTVNEIHDHVFDMKSHIVRGVLEHRLYQLIIGGSKTTAVPGHPHVDVTTTSLELDHELYTAIYGKAGSRLETTGVRGHLALVMSHPFGAGEIYTQPAFTLHDSATEDELVVTVMEKTTVHTGSASVVVPIGVEPDNDFDRLAAAPQDDLWDAIDRSLT